MTPIYLHDHESFPELLRIIEEEKDIQLGLVEKDYWIMHALYGLKKLGYTFQLKGRNLCPLKKEEFKLNFINLIIHIRLIHRLSAICTTLS